MIYLFTLLKYLCSLEYKSNGTKILVSFIDSHKPMLYNYYLMMDHPGHFSIYYGSDSVMDITINMDDLSVLQYSLFHEAENKLIEIINVNFENNGMINISCRESAIGNPTEGIEDLPLVFHNNSLDLMKSLLL